MSAIGTYRPGRVRRHVRSWRKPTPHSKAHPLVNRPNLALSEQIGTSLREANKRSTLVHHEPAALNRQAQTSLVFRRRAFLAKQKRPVDLLDMDAAVLHGLRAVGDLRDLAGWLIGIGVRSVRGEFHMPSLSSRMGRPGRESKRANAPKRDSSFAPINGHRQPGGARS